MNNHLSYSAWSILAALCLLLAGCFTSSQPKFPLSTAVAALGDGGRYVSYERMSDGSFKPDESLTVRHRADGGYDFTDTKGKVTALSLHRIGADMYVAQAMRDDGKTAEYAVLRVRGNEVLSYIPNCAKQDKAKLLALGVEFREHDVCDIDKVADPTAFFAALTLGEQGGKLVRE